MQVPLSGSWTRYDPFLSCVLAKDFFEEARFNYREGWHPYTEAHGSQAKADAKAGRFCSEAGIEGVPL